MLPLAGQKIIGMGHGLSFIGSVVLTGLLTSAFALWSLTCLGGAACDIMQTIL